MHLTGEYHIAADRATVWRALNDPDILRQSIPGCESVEKLSDTELTAKVMLAVGPVKARFSAKVTLADLDPPNAYTILGEGQGGVAGFGKGKAQVRLIEQDGGTLLSYSAEATVGGKIAQLGARLIDGTAKKLAAEFFSRFAAVVSGSAEAAAGGEPAAVAAPEPSGVEPVGVATSPSLAAGSTAAATVAAGAPPGARLSPAIWIPALIVVLAVILYLATRS